MSLPTVAKIKRGALVVDYLGSKWAVACAYHSERPYHLDPVVDESGDPVLHPDTGEQLMQPRRVNADGHLAYTGEQAPGFQPDCVGCEETAENTIDHIMRVENDQAMAKRRLDREFKRITRGMA